jgi:hypothetical protein
MMPFLFWALCTVNILLLLLAVLGKGFRSGYGAGVDINVIIMIGTLIVLVSSLVLKFSTKQKWISLVVVSLPVICMFVWYVFEKITGKSI